MTKGGVKMCLYSYTSIMFDEEDITDENVKEIENALFDFQYNHKDSEKCDYIIFAIAQKISDKKGLPKLDFFECSKRANNIAVTVTKQNSNS